MEKRKTQKLAIAALFTALCCVLTMFPQVPTPATNGYVHMGDALVLVSAFSLGGVYGPLAVGIGSALADLFSGYAHYVPATLIIKYLLALTAYALFGVLKKTGFPVFIARVISAIVGEAVMIFGYFLYSSLLLGDKLSAALTSIPSNAVQGAFGVIVGVALTTVVTKSRQLKDILSIFSKKGNE